ncbi:putative pectinesterase/pectinesterase inhibitor 17 [Silene latifolia]|uniref:putative pectinesterase/pectinesterase inhibitor 17 n=1 Tax=Silene latifolia TaxID=37657 RepID=UPI003D77774A
MQHQNVTMHIQIISFFILISSLIMINGEIPLNNLSSWCKQTPYSEQCEYYLTQNKENTFPINGKQDFLTMVIKNAMGNLIQAHQNAYSLSSSNVESEVEKAVWLDCLDLYELAIDHLNQTITNTKCTKFDTQTWLSTALTSHQTCQNGFNDMNLQNKFMPNNLNISSLISNALAINNDGDTDTDTASWTKTEKDGFPSWVRPGDRKLLQSMGGGGDIVVAQDGSGDYSSVEAAISAASSKSKGGSRLVIYIKTGTYKENINIGLKNIMLKGDGIGKTIITGSKSVGGGATTFRSATVAAMGSGFMAQGITFSNTAGPGNHQAVAFRSNSDLSVFYQCSFEGYQDTLYVLTNRQFYRECNIYGTVDFIFGNAAVVLQNCNILPRHPPNGLNTLTAQGRTDPNQNTGIVIHNCRVTAAEGLGGANTYLGRPWQKYSRTVFMKTYLDSIINPKGWYPWSGNFALSTLYYAEFANTGPGSSTGSRVNWPGYHVIGASDAGRFTVGSFIAGGSWIPNTGVPFTSGL